MLGEAADGVFDAKEYAVIGALANADLATLEKWLAPLDRDPEAAVLAGAIRAALGDLRGAGGAAVHLSRLLAARASPEQLARALGKLEETGASALVRVLRAEIDIETGELEALAASLSQGAAGDDEHKRDRALLAGLLFELADKGARARELYDAALSADPECEAAARARIAVAGPNERTRLLEEFAQPRGSAHERAGPSRGGARRGRRERPGNLPAPPQAGARESPFASVCVLARRKASSGTRRVGEHRRVAEGASTGIGRPRRSGLRPGARSPSHRRPRPRSSQGLARASIASAPRGSGAARALRAPLSRTAAGQSRLLGRESGGCHRFGSSAPGALRRSRVRARRKLRTGRASVAALATNRGQCLRSHLHRTKRS